MNQRTNKRSSIGGISLVMLMLAFLFTHSWTEINTQERWSSDELTISVSPADQLVFRDSDSLSESLLSVSNNVFSYGQIHNLIVDLPGLELSTNKALLVPHSLYNTFYTTTFIGAP